LKSFIVAGIRFYSRWISPGFPASCRFSPTCSAYAMEAVKQNGALRGSALAVKRLLKCHPWHPGGYDPVPTSGKMEISGRRFLGKEVLQNPACCDKNTLILTAPRTSAPLKR